MKYISINKKDLSKCKFSHIINEYGFCKPDGGLWASEFIDDSSDWINWLIYENDVFESNSHLKEMANPCSIIFTLKDNAKIYIIDSYNDFLNIVEKYKIVYENIRINHEFVNFEEMSKDYDGIKLTKAGCNNTSSIFLNPNLNGWDCESILLFNLECIDTWRNYECKFIKKERED